MVKKGGGSMTNLEINLCYCSSQSKGFMCILFIGIILVDEKYLFPTLVKITFLRGIFAKGWNSQWN